MTEIRTIKDIMSPEPRILSPQDTVAEAARVMAEENIGTVLIGADDRLVGILTDRDIVVRALAESRGAQCPVSDVMTQGIKYVFDDESVDDLVRNMGMQKIRRFPVLSRSKRLVGVVSLGDLAIRAQHGGFREALQGISRSGRSAH